MKGYPTMYLKTRNLRNHWKGYPTILLKTKDEKTGGGGISHDVVDNKSVIVRRPRYY
jgi:hypothetical protein